MRGFIEVLIMAKLLVETAQRQGESEIDLSGLLLSAVEESRQIVSMRDEDGNAMCGLAAWERARDYLLDVAGRVRDRYGVAVPAPSISPGPDGGVDFHWRGGPREMLLNVPGDAAKAITFYGQDGAGNSIKGTTTSTDNGGLLIWLATQA